MTLDLALGVPPGTDECLPAFLDMPKHSTRSRDAALERAHVLLSGIERSLERNDVSAEVLVALDSDFQLFRRQYLAKFGDYERMALGAQILDVELKLIELKTADHRH